MELAQPVHRPEHQRLTVAAAALSVLCVLALPPVVAGILDLAGPLDDRPRFSLTHRAELVSRLPGATVLQDSVIVTLTPEMHSPVMRPSQQVLPQDSAGQLVPLGVSGLLPMNPYLAPAGTRHLTSALWPGDKVFSNLGPLVVGCLPAVGAPGECTPTLLTQHASGYFLYPRSWGSSSFLEDGSVMQAEVFAIVGGQVVAGGLPGVETDRVEVRLVDGDSVTAFTTVSASPGDTVWWAATTKPPVQATAYDDAGSVIATLDLDPDDIARRSTTSTAGG